MSGPEGSSNKHCIVCAVGIFCPEHSTICKFSADDESALFAFIHIFLTFFVFFQAFLRNILYNKKQWILEKQVTKTRLRMIYLKVGQRRNTE